MSCNLNRRKHKQKPLNNMLDKLKLIAIKLRWLKPISLVIMLCSVIVMGYILFTQTNHAKNDYYLIPSILTALWSFSVYWCLYTFPNAPEKADKSLGIFKRFIVRCKRFSYYIVTLIAFALSLVILMFTARALRVWFGDFS